MTSSTRLNLVLASVCLGVADGLVQLDFTRQAGSGAVNLAGRDSSSIPLGGQFAFVVNATVGTPGQPVSLYVSPSVADTWVPDATTSYCDEDYYGHNFYDDDDEIESNPTYCLLGAFNKSQSSTYLDASQKVSSFDYSAPDGSYGLGENGTDTLKVGGLEFEDFPIGLVSSSSRWVGVLGLGTNDSYYSYSRYSNFPDRLLQTGQIKTKAYSIWLDDPAGASGSILFGAIDTSRYDGDLVRINGYASYAYSDTFGVEVTGFNGSSFGNLAWNELPFDATIGPAEVVSNLPYDIASQIWQLSGATYNSTIRAAVIPCDAAEEKDDEGEVYRIQLAGSDGPILEVHLADLIIPTEVTKTMSISYYMEDSPSLCLFGVQNVSSSASSSSSYDYYNLGSSLLRRTYAVFDLENSEVALAPTKFSGRSDPNVVEFASMGAPAPSATRYCSGSSYSCGSSSLPTSRPGRNGDDGNFTRRMGTVIGLSVAFGIIALIGLVATLIIWKRLCCGPRSKVGLDTKSDMDAENASVTAADTTAAAAAAAQGQRNSVVGPRHPLETIPESEMAQTGNGQIFTSAPVLPPRPPRSVSPPSPDQNTQASTDPATAQPPSPDLEDNTREREVSELGETSATGQDNEHNEASATAVDKGKGKAVDTTDN